MNDEHKPRNQLLKELRELRKRVAVLEGKYRDCEAQSREAQNKYEAVAAAFDGLIYIGSQDYVVEYMNDRLVKRTGRNAVGEKCHKALHDLGKRCPWCVNERVFRGETIRWETVSPKDNRAYYIVNAPFRHADGRVAKIAIIQDVTERRNAEEALRRHEQTLQNILLSSPTGISYFEDGRFKWANQAMYHIFGEEDQESYSGNTPDFFYASQEEYNRVRDVFYESLRDGRLAETDAKFRRKNGEVFDGHIKICALDPAEPRKGTIATISDISARKRAEEALQKARAELECRVEERTAELKAANEKLLREIAERKRAELELRQAEAKYRTLVEQMPAVTYVAELDEASTTVYVSPQIERFLGVSPDDYKADPDMWRKRLHPDDRQRVMAAVANSQATGEPFVSEYRMVADDGRIVCFRDEAILVRDPQQQPLFLQGIMLDITERRHAEEALRRSEERFRAIFEGAPDCVYIKDQDLRYTHVNPAMGTLLNLGPVEIVGRTDQDLFGEVAGRQLREWDLRVLGGQGIEQEHTRPVNGEQLTFHDTKVPLRDARGDIVGICGISRNITERKRVTPASPITVTEYPSAAMQATLEKARYAAPTDSIILLLGESGTGKDYLARWIHDHSRRSNSPFFAINCAALAPDLADSELFGHEPGAFTGARGRKRGLLELAEGGTLLLNEIGELSPALQAKLLTFLDTRSFLRVGGEKRIFVDARLIAATHRDLEAEVDAGRFLKPLFYRLNVFSIRVPPLRDRKEDIPVLVDLIVSQLATEMQLSNLPRIDDNALRLLSSYAWPGNVRELRNVLERASMLSERGDIRMVLPHVGKDAQEWSIRVHFPTEKTLRDTTDEVTRSIVAEALRRSRRGKRGAAQLLGISRDALYRHMKRLDLTGDSVTRD